MVQLDTSLRLVMLQFSFSNPDAIPPLVAHRNPETPEERTERKSRSDGTMLIQPTPDCSLLQFLDELENAGYELVDAFHKERIDAKDPAGKRMYHMARFVFARREYAKPSDEFRKARDLIRAELWGVCEKTIWRVRAYLNPFYKDGVEIARQHAISVNLEARTPLFRPDGQPVTVWQKDKDGNRLGDAPLPLQPAHHLRIVANAMQLVAT